MALMRVFVLAPALASLLLTTGCAAPRWPIGFWSRNRLRPDGSQQGPWRTYFDAADTGVMPHLFVEIDGVKRGPTR